MIESDFRIKLAKKVIGFSFALIPYLAILSLMGGYTYNESIELIKFFMPIKTLYVATVWKYLLTNRHETTEDTSSNDPKIKQQIIKISSWIINTYVIIIYLLLLIRALGGTSLTFAYLKDLLTLTETLFGACIGMLVTDLFKIEEDKPKK